MKLIIFLSIFAYGLMGYVSIPLLFAGIMVSYLLKLNKSLYNYKLAPYAVYLFIEIIKSSISVTKIIWSYNLKLNPALRYVASGQKTKSGLILYANSITLTPGTFTVNTINNKLLVHSIKQEWLLSLEADVLLKHKVSSVSKRCC